MDKINQIKQKPVLFNRTGRMEILAAGKNPTVVAIPKVVGISVISVEPQLRIMILNVEHVQIAIRVSNT